MFDTSGLNELAKDCESKALVARLSSGYHVLLSETNVSEIGATPDAGTRDSLLKLCQRLVQRGECMQPPQGILNALAKRHLADPERFDWRQVDVRFQSLEVEIARQEFLGAESVADELRSDNKATNKGFKEMFKTARPATIGTSIWDGASSVREVLDLLSADESSLWSLAADIYLIGSEQPAANIRGFVERCPPVRASLLAMCIGLYHWAAKKETEQSVYRAGALDLLMAAYLPYCDTFVTRDDGQHAALHLVAERAGLAMEVCTYTTWREKMLWLGARSGVDQL